MKREQVIQILAEHQSELRDFKVKSLELFGSVARGDSAEASDVDLLVEFEPDARVGMFHFLRLKEYLEQILGVEKVDLVLRSAVHKALKEIIYSEAIRVPLEVEIPR